VKIAVASGKGGTGKTLVATSLAATWASRGHGVAYVDADVEEPNGHLFLSPRVEEERFCVKVPRLSGKRCEGSGKCNICAFNAIIPLGDSVMVFDQLCHSCGACVLACPGGYLVERDREIGTVSRGSAGDLRFWSARLDVGEARSTPLIEGLIGKAVAAEDAPERLVVIDSPPGTTCPAMASVESADLVLMVTEPTPFGDHDLRLAVEMGKALGKPMAAVVNRSDLGDDRVAETLAEAGVDVLARIPFEREVAAAYASGKMAIEECGGFASRIVALADALDSRLEGASK